MSRTTTRWLSAASDDGVALITVIGIMVVVTILAIGSFTLAEQSLFEATRTEDETRAFRAAMNTLDHCDAQIRAVTTFFDTLADRHPVLPAANDARVALRA